MANNQVSDYYDQRMYGLDSAAGAGLIWYMSQDHLSPPASNEDRYALDAHKWREATSMRILALGDRMEIKAGSLVLDMGTGIGGPGRDLTKKFGCDVVGINLSLIQLQTLKKISAQQSVEYTMVVNGDMQELPFGDEVFEDVISINAMYHVPRPEKVIEETVRVLKPGGKFGLDDWFTTSLTRPETVQRLRHNWSTPPNGFHSVSRTLSLLESQGLSIIDAEDFTQEAAAFLTEERFGKTFDSQVAPTLVTVFPHLYKYEGYRPEHALQAVSQLKSDALYMGELYRNREATYMEIMAQKDSVEVIYSHQS